MKQNKIILNASSGEKKKFELRAIYTNERRRGGTVQPLVTRRAPPPPVLNT